MGSGDSEIGLDGEEDDDDEIEVGPGGAVAGKQQPLEDSDDEF